MARQNLPGLRFSNPATLVPFTCRTSSTYRCTTFVTCVLALPVHMALAPNRFKPLASAVSMGSALVPLQPLGGSVSASGLSSCYNLRRGCFRYYQNVTFVTLASAEFEGKATPPRSRHHSTRAASGGNFAASSAANGLPGHYLVAHYSPRASYTAPSLLHSPHALVKRGSFQRNSFGTVRTVTCQRLSQPPGP